MIKVNVEEYIDWIKKYSDVCELDKVRLYKKLGALIILQSTNRKHNT